MPYKTDERLKGYLDTNQLDRERMCQAILATDHRFSDVHPRHPRGGRDGGRDIQAIYNREQTAFAAVGFTNQANDSEKQKRQIKKKFKDDVMVALSAKETAEVFVFLTNINFTIREKDSLIALAKKKGFKVCDIMDRERLRITLDSPDGFATRFQYLGLPLSEEEQASFFARWGDEINSVISSGFQTIEKKLDRILFLQEAVEVLSLLTIALQLDREYDADDIGHFRAFTTMYLKPPKHNVASIVFGSSDRPKRMWPMFGSDFASESAGIRNGISSGAWVSYIDAEAEEGSESPENDDDNIEYTIITSSTSRGINRVEYLSLTFDNDPFTRTIPELSLFDFNDSFFYLLLNSSLASKVKAIHIYANGYKFQQIDRSEFAIYPAKGEPQISVQFTEDETNDPWVRIGPNNLTYGFEISFSSQTPKRMYESPPVRDSVVDRRRR